MPANQRFIAERLHGDGTAEFIHWDLPVKDTAAITDVLSGPPQLTAQIDSAYEGLKVNRRPLLGAGSTAIYYEEDDVIRNGWLLADPAPEGATLHLDGSGFCGYPNPMSYNDEYSRIGVDPADVLRHIWAYVQGFPNGNLGMVLDSTTTPVRLGTPGVADVPGYTAPTPVIVLAAQAILDRMNSGLLVSADWTWAGCPSIVNTYNDALLTLYSPGDVNDIAAAKTWLQTYITDNTPRAQTLGGGADAKPYTIAWFNNDMLGSKIRDLAIQTPLEFHEEHAWNDDHTAITHFLRIGYPRLGRQRDDLRFVLGENIDIPPRIDLGSSYANEVTVFGSGEGRDMVRSTSSINDGRLRSEAIVTDKTILTVDAARRRAQIELNIRQRFSDVSVVTVRDMPTGASGLVQVGDTIRLQVEEEWTDLDLWVRVLSITTTPLKRTDAVMEVTPV